RLRVDSISLELRGPHFCRNMQNQLKQPWHSSELQVPLTRCSSVTVKFLISFLMLFFSSSNVTPIASIILKSQLVVLISNLTRSWIVDLEGAMAILERYILSKSKKFQNLATYPGIVPLAPIINPVTVILSN
ncbi:hypothetical protein L9F63_010692, partial [Diploptera punctata]